MAKENKSTTPLDLATLSHEELLAVAKAAAKENAKLKSDLDEAEALIEELKSGAAEGTKFPSVKVGNKTYFVTASMRGKGGVLITAEEIAKDTDLCAKLLKKKATILIPA